jgi:D-arabinose 1-dehydrogenase-like Zn-dependent alcohol dehydrogenase
MTIGRRAIFLGPGQPMEIVEGPVPEPAEGEAVAEIELATICRSDVWTWSGRRHGHLPAVLGHEAVGRIIASRRADGPVGMRAVWSIAAACGSCPACADWALPQKCRSLFKYGHAGDGWDGCFATHVVLRPGTAIAAVNEGANAADVALAGCGVATGLEAARLATGPADLAVVLGAGVLGLAAGWSLKQAGWSVVISDPMPGRQPVILGLGLEPSSDWSRKCSLVLEACGHAEALAAAPQLLRPGGQMILAGLVTPGTELPFSGEAIVRGCWRVQGLHNYPPSGVHQAVKAAEKIGLGLYVQPPFPLDKIDDAMQAASTTLALRESIDPWL